MTIAPCQRRKALPELTDKQIRADLFLIQRQRGGCCQHGISIRRLQTLDPECVGTCLLLICHDKLVSPTSTSRRTRANLSNAELD
jgi:hypothetical protein